MSRLESRHFYFVMRCILSRLPLLTELSVSQSSSGAYFIVVAQSIFANSMVKRIRHIAPHLDPLRVLGTGASEIRDVFKGSDRTAVLDAYLSGLKDVFACALAASACAVLVSLMIPFQRLPAHDSKSAEESSTDAGSTIERNEKEATVNQ
jgi:hypothetical protein